METETKKEESLFSSLKALSQSGFYPFHMPGHKRNKRLVGDCGLWEEDYSPYDIDITEIDGFDDLHEAEGLIKNIEDLATELYGAKRSFLSVNGSTGAILAAIGAGTKRGDTVIVSRNSHKSVYHAIELYGLYPIYLKGTCDDMGIYGEMKAEEVEEALIRAEREGRKASLVSITSPTYEGRVSDIKRIAEVCHRHGALLFTDEAHGAHFGLEKSGFFPESAVRLGADMTTVSLHKTLPSYTQTALLHIGKENEGLIGKVKRKLSVLQTSSPSYILTAGIETCLLSVKERGEELFLAYRRRLSDFYRETEKLVHIRILREEGKDPGKLVISAGRGSGSFLYDYFYKEKKLVMEMKSRDYVIAMTSLFDTEEGFSRLFSALVELDERIAFGLDKEENSDYTSYSPTADGAEELPKMRLLPAEATELAEEEKHFLPLREAKGKVSADYVYFYPPGIPVITPGEEVDEAVIRKIKEGISAEIRIYGGSDGHGIFVCADGKERNGEGQYL